MRRTIVFGVIAATAAIAADSAFAQVAGAGASANPRVAISEVAFDANGRSPATASSSYDKDFTHFAYAGKTICQIGGSNYAAGRAMRQAYASSARGSGSGGASFSTMPAELRPPDRAVMPTDAGFGWRVDGKVVSASPNEVVVQIDWQRMWDRGETVSGPRGSTQLALHPGERVPLDSITTIAVPGECTGVTFTLQASFAAATGGVGVGRGGRGGGAGGVAVVGTGAAGGVSNVGTRGGGAGVGATGGVMGGVSGEGTGGGRGRGAVAGGGFGGALGGGGGRGFSAGRGGVSSSPDGTMIVQSGFDPQTLHLIDAELWLVHKKPDGSEVAQQRAVRTVPGTGEFTFDAVTVSTDRSYVVTVSGSVQAQRLPDGTEKLFVGIIRRIAVPGTGGYFSQGGSGRTVAMPRAGDVISFEMPDTGAKSVPTPQVPDRWINPLPGHEFSVRVRVNR